MTLIDFLTCSKLLLQKARSALIDGQRSNSFDTASNNSGGMSGSVSAPNLAGTALTSRSSLSGVSPSTTAGNRSSLGSATLLGGSSSNADAAAESAAAREQAQFLTWQTEMEKAYEGLLQSIMPYLSDLNDSDLLINLK